MASDSERLKILSRALTSDRSMEELAEALRPKKGPPLLRIPAGSGMDPISVRARWQAFERGDLADRFSPTEGPEPYAANIEHFMGTLQIPVGVAGPVRINGLHAQGDIALPLATTEAALVASYHRGARLLTKCGGCTALLEAEGVTRSPGFSFANLREAGLFQSWLIEQESRFAEIAAGTSRFGRLDGMRILSESCSVYLLLDYTTGDAAGQNMVTIATDAICRDLLARSPVTPRHWFVEANASGDKKASAQSFASVRGKKVAAEALIPGAVVRRALHTSSKRMEDYWRMSALGGVLTGTIGVQGHYANGLAALFLATGQDAACVAEAAVGITKLEEREGDLYISVTLPNLIVGTVGGGTGLPHQRSCLELMGMAGSGRARAFAEACAACALAGELSIIGALAAGEFAGAHQKLARERRHAPEI